jgi:type IV secretion system protein VirD4
VTRRLISVLVLAVLTLLGNVAATQYLARTFQSAPELGEPLVAVRGTNVYPPLSWYQWQRSWGKHAPKTFATAMAMALAGFVFGLGIAMRVRGTSRQPKATGAYGTARWSELSELKAAQLLEPSGIVLCQTNDARFRQKPRGGWALTAPGQLIRHDGPEHAIVFAPTRSGKGVGVVVPTLLAWTGSVIVYDTKRENWDLTAGWRRKFSHCLRFDPTNEHSVRFNPLMEVRPAPLDVRDAQNIAEILVNPDTTEDQRDHWKLTGHAFLVAVILHVLYAEDDKSLAGVLKFLTDPNRTLLEQLTIMLETQHVREGTHPAVAGGAREMLNRSENERSGVLSTSISFLSLYRDPLIAANTSSSDFALADIMCATRPVSLYLVVPPSDFDRTRPVMRLLLNFFGRRLTEYLDQVDGPGGRRDKRHRLLYLIDEFPSLGRMPFFVTSLAFLAGYRIKCLLIAQSLNQLDQAYGRDNPILDNCHIRLTYGANDERTAKRISDLIGQGSLVKVQLSEGEREGIFASPRVNRSYQEYGRPLKTPDELLSLDFTDAILMVGNLRPYLAKKVMFYEDARFSGRAFDSRTRTHAPPDSVRAQRAELPPQTAVPHWLSIGQAPVASPVAAPRRATTEAPARRPEPDPFLATSPDGNAGTEQEDPMNGEAPAEVASLGSHWDYLVDSTFADPGARSEPTETEST